jgi:2-methylcitrate dehydratase PrpD
MMTAEEAVAAFVTGLREDDLPHDVCAIAAEACLDCVGVMVAGSVEEPAALMRAQLNLCETGPSAVVGTGLRGAPLDAALANGVAGHVLDYDDMGAFGHPSAVLAPAVLAVGETQGVSGRRLLTAYAAGFEIGAALAEGLSISQGETGLHQTGMIGVFAATAAAGNLLGLTAEQVMMAMGIAASTPAGLVQNFGTFTKSLHAGMTARNGVMAASLAAAGWTANPRAFEGPGGVMAVYGRPDTKRLRHALSTLGDEWRIRTEATLKRFPCCGSTHAAVTSITALLREAGVTADEVEWLEVGELPPASHVLLYPEAYTGFEGKFSLAYVAARALSDGDVTVDTFNPDAVGDARYLAVKDKVRIRIGSKWDHGGEAFWPATTVTMRLTDGRTLTHSTDRYTMPGTRAQPLSADAVREKFVANCTRAGVDGAAAYAAWSRLPESRNLSEAIGSVTRKGA